jgi:hypothetical protein
MIALEHLSSIFELALPSHTMIMTSPQVEISDSDTPPRVHNTVSPPRVPNAATPPRVVQPIVTHIATPNSTPCRAVTPSTTHHMIMISSTQFFLSNGMLAETVQKANHIFSLPTGPSVRTAKSTTQTEQLIIIPKMVNAVI